MLCTSQNKAMQRLCDAVAVVGAGHPVGTCLHLGVAVAHGHAHAGQAQHLEIVVLVAKSNHFLACDTLSGDPLGEAGALAVAGARAMSRR